ncbi:hypothetical protein [Azospirillum sp. ST 5-10]|uniref:hypothetical protein n=1 Tax=unclassified Azospirillum TaxID=2630922 RepID=UPI003F4A668B
MHRRTELGMTVASTLALVLMALPSSTRSEVPVTAQLGDHGAFSRLVVSVAGGALPRAVSDPCSVRLERDEATAWPLDTLNGVWASRMSGFQSLDDGRTMAASIPCGARVTALRERNLLIVDVAAPPIPARKPGSTPPAPAMAEPGGREDAPAAVATAAAPPPAGTPAAQDTPSPLAAVAAAVNPVAVAQAQPVAPAAVTAMPPVGGAAMPPAAATPATAPAPAAGAPPPAADPASLEAAVQRSVEQTLRLLEGRPASQPAAAERREPDPPPIGPMDLAAWAGDDFTETRATLQQALSDTLARARVDAFVAMARFALARALEEEGRATLDAAAAQNPAADQRYSLQVLNDAFRALDRSADPDASLFVRIPPGASPDHHVWRSATLAPTRWAAAHEGLPIALKRLLDYPAELRSRLLSLLAESADAARDADALNLIVLEMITVDARSMADGRLDYFRGRLAELRDTPETALQHYRKSADVRGGPFGRRAEVRAIELRRTTGALDDEGAIAELEALRYAWRGDDVEIDALAALGGAYARTGRTEAALDMFGMLGRRFGATARGRDALAAGRGLLKAVLERIEGEAPGGLYALALQARHGRLVTLADDDEATLRQRLARALARDGFTVEAIRVLEGLTGQATGARQAMLGAALARTLIDAGRDADALDVLNRTGNAALDAGLAERRTLLRAEALIAGGETVRALDSLRGMPGVAAARLRARSLFDSGEWTAARDALAELVDGQPAPAAEDVALLGLAAHLAGDGAMVHDLAARHGARLAGTRWNGLLDALAPLPADDRPVKADDVARQLAAADAIERLARRWQTIP